MALTILMILGANCSETGLKQRDDESPDPVALIELDPDRVDFGGLVSGQTATATVEVKNPGDVALWVDELELQSAAFTLVDDGGLLVNPLSPGGQSELVISYTPVNPSDSAWLVVHSDAENDPDARLELTGEAMLSGLALDPGYLSFGDVAIDASSTLPVDIVNIGDAPLTVTSVTVNGDDAFVGVIGQALPLVLDPGERVPVDVTFTPDDYGRFSGTLWVGSDAPAGPSSAPLYGTSGVPVAVCEASPDQIYAGYESADFLGHDSYDPEGLEITSWDWTMVTRPSGSAARLGAADAIGDIVGFDPDLAGTYEAALVVENELGMQSDACVATLDAVPAESLWIEMYWDHSQDDMDLHLQSGAEDRGLLEGDADCYYANCVGGGLDWGEAGNPDDDPSLDLDDIPGTGPENINILKPAEGTYTVWVQDFPGTVWNGDNEVTVKVYVDGALVWQDERVISEENAYEAFCEVDWPGGAVTAL